MIICDFIDMEKQQNREKVYKAMQEALGRDKAKTHVLRISEMGLVEMTRKRVRESIGRVLHEDCSYCDGQGFVKTATTVCYEIFREIRREAPNFKDPTLVINCSNEVAKLLQGDEREELRHMMDRFNKTIQIRPQQNYHREQYDIYGRTAQGTDHKLMQSVHRGEGSPPPPQGRQERSQERPQGREGGRDRDRPRREGRGGRDNNRDNDERRERRGERRDEGRNQGEGGSQGAAKPHPAP
jgi:ribonuclease G